MWINVWFLVFPAKLCWLQRRKGVHEYIFCLFKKYDPTGLFWCILGIYVKSRRMHPHYIHYRVPKQSYDGRYLWELLVFWFLSFKYVDFDTSWILSISNGQWFSCKQRIIIYSMKQFLVEDIITWSIFW